LEFNLRSLQIVGFCGWYRLAEKGNLLEGVVLKKSEGPF
jgi:hypothetical protein